MKLFYTMAGLFAGICLAGAQPTRLSITLLPPSFVQLSWPSNAMTWQLVNNTNLTSSNGWNPVLIPPAYVSNSFVVSYPLTNVSEFFRLQEAGSNGGGGGTCTFQAMPPSISPGGSSTLSWSVAPNTAYSIFPTPGPVTGSNLVVSPASTTTFILLASNTISGSITDCFATVTVGSSNSNPCGFASLSGWDGTLTFSYALNPTNPSYYFDIHQMANLNFHLTPTNLTPLSAEYVGYVNGTASLDDTFKDMTGIPVQVTTLVGSGAPQPDINIVQASLLTLDINCTTGTYTFTITPEITALLTQHDGSSGDVPYSVGGVTVNQRALPATVGTLFSSELLPARGPFWTGGGDFYAVGGLGIGMFEPGPAGIVTDTTAGSAAVSWSFTPTP